MENFRPNNQNENKETGWEITVEDQRAAIEAQIQMLEAQRLKLEKHKCARNFNICAMLIGMKWIIKTFTNQ